MEKALTIGKKMLPQNVFNFFAPIYHYIMALLSAIIYRFPSRNLNIVAITGTKGKTTTVELINAILEEAGFKTALSGTLRFKIGETSKNNLYKMSMPGRFVIQSFLRNALKEKCTHVVMEITSQGVLQYRQKYIDLDALIFTNLAPEHIEAHGSYENYRAAKLKIAEGLASSSKKRKVLVVNADDKEAPHFLKYKVDKQHTYSLKNAESIDLKEEGISFVYDGVRITSELTGEFNLYNILAAITYAKTQGISMDIIKRAIEKLSSVRGRVEKIDLGQDFRVIIDYAHTPDSLQQLYRAFNDARKICVLGNTGGGRDTWKRKEMARIADQYCDQIILTNEDPYDEDPQKIVNEMKEAIIADKVEIIMDRREAIKKALSYAKTNDAVLVSGKGTDPFIMGPSGSKIPWNDAEVAREELKKILN